MATQIGSEHIGFNSYLHRRKVSGVDDPSFSCGFLSQNVEHMITACPRWSKGRAEVWRKAKERSFKAMMNSPEDIARITRWIIKEEWLVQFRLVENVENTIEARRIRPESRRVGRREKERGPYATMQHLSHFLKEHLEDFAKVVGEWSRNIGRQELRTATGVETLANDLVETLSEAIKATGRQGSPQLGQSAPWWTDECREAKSASRANGDDASKKAFRQAVKIAKRQYWRRKFSEAKTDSDICRMARWAKPQQEGKTAPLRTANGFASDPRRRATLLCDMLLARFTSENDIEAITGPTNAEPGTDHLPWTIEVTEEEAKWVATSCQDKAPGADNITVRLLRAAWPAIGQAVRALYE
ncbi:hypothetical protein K3495_g7939 [Podosphaera aphanis]|nr:hypothetical protein K3495_g7939 [Podosphaera aphanis]